MVGYDLRKRDAFGIGFLESYGSIVPIGSFPTMEELERAYTSLVEIARDKKPVPITKLNTNSPWRDGEVDILFDLLERKWNEGID